MSEASPTKSDASGGGDHPSASRHVVLALAMCQLTSWGVLYYAVTGLIFAINQETGWSHAEILAGPMVALVTSSLVSPAVGRIIDQGLGRLVLNLGTLVGCCSLMLWAWAETYPLYIAAWIVIGVAQAMSLYDAAFAVMIHRLGTAAKRPIVAVTLVGGFAGSVFVPLAYSMSAVVGWRMAVVLLAGLLSLNVAWQVFVLPKAQAMNKEDSPPPGLKMSPDLFLNLNFWLGAASFTALAAAFSIVTFHLIPMLVANGMSEKIASYVFALIGPSQVLARLMLLWLPSARPWRLALALHAFLVLSFVLMVTSDATVLWMAVVMYGLSNGLQTLLRPQLIWTLFGTQFFGSVNGALALPQQLIKAVAPFAAAHLVSTDSSYFGLNMLLLGLAGISGVSLVVAFWYSVSSGHQDGRRG